MSETPIDSHGLTAQHSTIIGAWEHTNAKHTRPPSVLCRGKGANGGGGATRGDEQQSGVLAQDHMGISILEIVTKFKLQSRWR